MPASTRAPSWIAAAVIGSAVLIVVIVLAVVGGMVEGHSAAARSLIVIVGFAALFGMIALVAIGYWLAGLDDTTQALGLPSGSVRAIIALLIIAMFAVLAVYFSELLKTNSCPAVTSTDTSATPPKQVSAIDGVFGNIALAQSPATGTLTSSGATTSDLVPSKGTGSTGGAPSADNTKIESVNDVAKQVLQILGTLMTTIVGFYFGSTSATEAATKTGEAIATAAKALKQG
jgi:hypothetical protein